MRVHSHYENLTVTRDATPEVIRAAYKALSQMWHPDKNNSPHASENMAVLNMAYETLGDPAKRAIYDAQIAAAERETTQHAFYRAQSQYNANPYSGRPETPDRSSERRRGTAFDIDDQALKEALRPHREKWGVGKKAFVFGSFPALAVVLSLISHGPPAG